MRKVVGRRRGVEMGKGSGALSCESIHTEPEVPWQRAARKKREAVEAHLRVDA